MTTQEKLGLLRRQMEMHHLDAYIVPSTDPHQSEYLAPHWKSREWLSGFTGSAGTLIILPSSAGLWTDSRYFLQAEQELAGSGIDLQKQKVPHAPEHIEWLSSTLPAGAKVGLDGSLFSVAQIRYMEKFFDSKGIALEWDKDLIRSVWQNRPALPDQPVFEHDVYFAGQPRQEKLNLIRKAMADCGSSCLVCTTLDDIAWALNLRGTDIECNPLFIAFLIITPQQVVLYSPLQKVSASLRSQLEKEGIALRPYESIEDDIREFPPQSTFWIDPTATSMTLYAQLKNRQIREAPNPIRDFKAIKNPTEIHHIRKAMQKDGIALLRLFRWLEEKLAKQEWVTEFQLSEQLIAFRKEQPDYRGESFPAIVGYQANGAIIHYRPQAETAATIRPEGLLLLDSGGQYLDGTTDITRTIALSPPNDVQKRHFTLVLKGHIALAASKFPPGTVGMQLDTLARLPLWKAGLNYGHGTGHGVGFFLSVHESPQGFASNPTTSRGTTPFVPGMLTSNEPGYYLQGAYGIRIENLILCASSSNPEEDGFFHFDTVTLFPIDKRLIALELLNAEEKEWLNDYHRKVFDELAPGLDQEERDWLNEQCLPV